MRRSRCFFREWEAKRLLQRGRLMLPHLTKSTGVRCPMKLLLTGGCGFIGSAVVRHLLRHTDHVVINVDKMTYAASEDALEEGLRHNRHILVKADIADAAAMRQVFETHDPDAVMHLAAESHVDRSIDGPADFVQTNVVGTFILLEAARRHYAVLTPAGRRRFGSIMSLPMRCSARWNMTTRRSPKTTPYDPRSPYSATKAASDHLVRAWSHTYKLPTIVSNTCNNYGPWQFPEKLIPLVTLNALEGHELPVYGDGSNMRDWLFVEDHAEALVRVVESGIPGETYAIGGRQPRTNLQVVQGDLRASRRAGARPGRPAGAADPVRHRPARPRFPL